MYQIALVVHGSQYNFFALGVHAREWVCWMNCRASRHGSISVLLRFSHTSVQYIHPIINILGEMQQDQDQSSNLRDSEKSNKNSGTL